MKKISVKYYMSKFKDTLYLPKTDYAMRANLKELEIKILE